MTVNSLPTCFTREICWSVVEVQISRAKYPKLANLQVNYLEEGRLGAIILGAL